MLAGELTVDPSISSQRSRRSPSRARARVRGAVNWMANLPELSVTALPRTEPLLPLPLTAYAVTELRSIGP